MEITTPKTTQTTTNKKAIPATSPITSGLFNIPNCFSINNIIVTKSNRMTAGGQRKLPAIIVAIASKSSFGSSLKTNRNCPTIHKIPVKKYEILKEELKLFVVV